MVIDEARALGLPILTTETTSSNDMVTEQQCGWVCENTQEAINSTLCRILADLMNRRTYPMREKQTSATNDLAFSQWKKMLNS